MILLTGATGYIGSHIWIELLKKGFPAIGLDNLSNSSIEMLEKIQALSAVKPLFIEGDIRSAKLVQNIFANNPITHVIHLAGLKNIEESMQKKAEYFEVNVCGLEILLKSMRSGGCSKIIFSSSAAVYGINALSPIVETDELAPFSYYGETKLAGEGLLYDEFSNSAPISSVSLRYFNVAGRHSSGLLPGDISGKSHSLFSEIQKVLSSKKEAVSIFGVDWNTKDGTCIRDYLHIEDVVQGHIDALELLNLNEGRFSINLGSGIGHSVYEVIDACEYVSARSIAKKIAKRRVGDVGISYASNDLAKKLLSWQPKKSLQDICQDSINMNDLSGNPTNIVVDLP